MVWAGVFLAACLIWYWASQPQSRLLKSPEPHTHYHFTLVCMVIACGFAIRHHTSTANYQSASVLGILTTTEEPTILVGVVDESIRLRRDPLDAVASWSPLDPRQLEGSEVTYQTTFVVDLKTLRRGLDQVPQSGRVRVSVGGDVSHLRPGDRVRLFGRISLVPPTSNPGQFDLQSWALRDDIHAMMRVQGDMQVELIESMAPADTTWFRVAQRAVADLSASARQSILRQTDPDQHGLALALVLGQRDLLPRSASETLIATGTAHLLSVSGLHLGILFVVARLIAGALRLRLGGQLLFLCVVTLFYVAITGGRPPVLRAAILLATVMMAIALARPHHPMNSLSLALILLLWWMPFEISGVGMQLSFLAVATLLMCGRRMNRNRTAVAHAIELEQGFDQLARQSSGRWRWLASTIGSSMVTAIWYSGCVSVMTLPLVWHSFHVVSPISVLVNVVLSPLMMVALSAGVATVILSWTVAPLAIASGSLCSVVLSLMRWVVEWAESIPGGHFWLPSPPAEWVVAFYVGMIVIMLARDRITPRRWISTWSAGWVLAAWWMATTPARLPEGALEATFVDVGHGTATILRTDRNEVWLYDCGWLGNFQNQSQKIDDVLWSMGIVHLDGVILSHADSDHFNALPGLSKRFSIGQVVTPPGLFTGEGRSIAITREAVDRMGIPVVELHRDSEPTAKPSGDLWEHAEILHPPEERIEGSDNANSLVLLLATSPNPLLLPGDLEPPGTAVLTNQPRPRPGGVMMAPHHGSLRMDADAVLQWARPRETVVSGGKRAAKPEVTEMLNAAGGGVHVTSKVGCVRVQIDENGEIAIRSWQIDPW